MKNELLFKTLALLALLTGTMVAGATSTHFSVEGMPSLDEALNVPGGTLHFISEGDYPWQVKTEGDRVYAQSSNAGVHNSASELSLPQFRLNELSVLSFDFKAWGESDPVSHANYDECYIMVNGKSIFRYGARDNDWETFSIILLPNVYYDIKWRYYKDVSDNGVGDYFALDNIKIAPTSLDDALNVPGGTLHFITEGDYPWQVMAEGDRVYAQSSNAGVHNSASELSLPQFRLDEPSILSFDFKAWGESDSVSHANYDECYIMVNGESVFRLGAYDNDWETFSMELLPNVYYDIKWRYYKDVSDNGVGDYFALDNIQIVPVTVRGDVTGDDSVNIDDVTALIDYLLSGNASGINLSGADCDKSGKVNIDDVTGLIDHLLNGNW